jgi:hypothetical protein
MNSWPSGASIDLFIGSDEVAVATEESKDPYPVD